MSIRVTVVAMFLLSCSLTAAVAIGLQYYFSKSLANSAAYSLFSQITANVSEKIRALDNRNGAILYMIEDFSSLAAKARPEGSHPAMNVMAKAMQLNPDLYAMYIAYESGDFFEVVNLESGESVRNQLQAVAEDRWVIIKILDLPEGRSRIIEYYDAEFQLRTRTSESSRFDATTRPYYRQAMEGGGLVKTDPYLFHNLQQPGITYAKRIKDSKDVIALDISLEGMSAFLDRQDSFPSSKTYIFKASGNISAAGGWNDHVEKQQPKAKVELDEVEKRFLADHEVIRVSNEMDWPPFDFSRGGQPLGYSIDVLTLLSEKTGLTFEFINGYSWPELVDLYKKGQIDLLHSLIRTESRVNLGIFTEGYFNLPDGLVVGDDAGGVQTLAELSGKVIAVPQGWATAEIIRTGYPEITLLPVENSLAALQAVSDGRAFGAIDSEAVLHYLKRAYYFDTLQVISEIPELTTDKIRNLRMVAPNSLAPLVSIINKGLNSLTAQEINDLETRWLTTMSAQEVAGEREDQAGLVLHEELIDLAETLSLSHRSASTTFVVHGVTHLGYVAKLTPLYGAEEFIAIVVQESDVTGAYLKKVRYSVMLTIALMLCLSPFSWLFATYIVEPVRQLARENEKIKQREFSRVVKVKSNITELAELSQSIYSMAGSIQVYQKSQEKLLDAFIKLIAQAIDEKSPYTGGHCARVPELAVMLAEAAERSDAPPFRKFSALSDDAWREFHIAAWLHDCGKVTTPEHIVDKGTKLEAIYNRIHEIRTRFEVLWRDAEIDYLQAVLADPGNEKYYLLQKQDKQNQHRADYAFIAACNVGGEFMDSENQQRVRQIARQTWVRHFDDRLGLSPVETEQYSGNHEPLPVTEYLLADKPSHLQEWKSPKEYDASFGFQMAIPDYQANLGEVYNLTVSKGTLTMEDRYRINEHIISTIRMLETLPLPEELERIPEIAGGHHETLIGTGYPRKLQENDLSIRARIIAVADVFEALTASDRPYKEPKTLNETLQIMAQMAKNKHIDSDLFELLLTSGVYSRYAEKYLPHQHLESLDISRYVRDMRITGMEVEND